MSSRSSLYSWQLLSSALISLLLIPTLHAQEAKLSIPQTPIPGADADHVKERNEWFYRGRVVRGQPAAELRRRAWQAKLRMRAQRAAATSPASLSSGSWIPLGPAPLASDATGNGTQNYNQVSGRATAVAIDPAAAHEVPSTKGTLGG